MIYVHNGVTYEIAISAEEASRRIADLIRALWPTYLDLKARQPADQTLGHQCPQDRIS